MGYKLLIVDDSKLARMAATKALSSLYPDWTRVEAASSDEALMSIRQERPDLALLDFNMPGQNGIDLAVEIRRSRPNMPIAVISANRQQEILNRVSEIGASFLTKPLTEGALAEFLRSAVRDLSNAR